jgi:hypothetical protein
MDKVIINEGGQPLFLEDLKFLQDSAGDAMKGLCKFVCGSYDAAYLSGIAVTSTDYVENDKNHRRYDWSDGYIALKGEVYPVAAGSLSVLLGTNVYWKVVATPSTQRTFKNGSQFNVREIRTVALVSAVADGDTYVAYSAVKPVIDIDSQSITVSGIPSGMGVALNYSQDGNGVRSLNGHIAVTGDSNISIPNGLLGTFDFPVGFAVARAIGLAGVDGSTAGGTCKTYMLYIYSAIGGSNETSFVKLFKYDGTPVTSLSPTAAGNFNFNLY